MNHTQLLRYCWVISATSLIVVSSLPLRAEPAADERAGQTLALPPVHHIDPQLLSTKPANTLVNPYSLLVSLAFGRKNELGITSYAQAHDYYCTQARDNTDVNAQFALGWLYSMGKGVEVNHDLAARFFSMAAAQGHKEAQTWLDKQQGDAEVASLPACMEKPLPVAATPTSVVAEQVPPAEEAADGVQTEVVKSGDLFYKRGPIYHMVKKHAPSYEIDVDFAMAVIAVESGFNPKATSPKNAQGLMQLMPETQVRFNVKDAYDPEENIKGGLSYLQWLISYFKGDVELVAAAYNAGENNVLKYRGVPPFPETRDYVKRITTYYKKKFHFYRSEHIIPRKHS